MRRLMEASKSDVFWKPSDNCTIGFFSKETKWENAQPAYSGMSSGDKLRECFWHENSYLSCDGPLSRWGVACLVIGDGSRNVGRR
ncbi:hypothetical protein MANES_13G128250v8 [Manihot esculenta]|uniref:Uncharacterized protein n=1 Tax=Manihot esculenta TaxID=3983 RepID=A0ACB7GMT4_MANES|nr:hypothetical protein MANES_13G128250v8 [Manihot esculenta]